MKPRLTAYDTLPPNQVAVVHLDPPLQPGEVTIVLALRGRQNLVVDETTPTRVTIRNTSNEPTPYVFTVVPEKLGRLFKADWRGLLNFFQSIHLLPAPPKE